MTLATDLRNGTSSLLELAERDLAAFWREVAVYEAAAYAGDLQARETLRAALHDVLPALAGSYQDAAIALAAELYDLERDRLNTPGTYRAPGIEVPDGGHALAGWALAEAVSPDGLHTLIGGALTRRVMKAANGTVMHAAVADPKAGGWYRVTRPKACDFCRFLAGRGDVYTRATVDFASHDHCHCIAAVAWGDSTGVLLDANGKRLTRSTAKTRTDDELRVIDNQNIRDWIESHPNSG